jgi:nicotinamidase-related amidase
MPIDLRPLVDPKSTAIISLEVQENLLLPEKGMVPGLAAHAHAIGLIDRLAEFFEAGRHVGTRVYYVTDERRADGYGQPGNVMVKVRPSDDVKSDMDHALSHGPIVAELTPRPEDVWLKREQGMTGFFSTPLDTYLSNAGVQTVILTGVSANVGINGTAIEAMNRGYRVIVARDGIAGDPPSYVEDLLRYTIRNVAVVASIQEIMDAWQSHQMT